MWVQRGRYELAWERMDTKEGWMRPLRADLAAGLTAGRDADQVRLLTDRDWEPSPVQEVS